MFVQATLYAVSQYYQVCACKPLLLPSIARAIPGAAARICCMYYAYYSTHIIMPDQYRNKAGKFRGVLIFVIFAVNLAVMKFSHP